MTECVETAKKSAGEFKRGGKLDQGKRKKKRKRLLLEILLQMQRSKIFPSPFQKTSDSVELEPLVE